MNRLQSFIPACVPLTLWYNTIEARDATLIARSCGNEVVHDADGSDFPECFCEVETLL